MYVGCICLASVTQPLICNATIEKCSTTVANLLAHTHQFHSPNIVHAVFDVIDVKGCANARIPRHHILSVHFRTARWRMLHYSDRCGANANATCERFRCREIRKRCCSTSVCEAHAQCRHIAFATSKSATTAPNTHTSAQCKSSAQRSRVASANERRASYSRRTDKSCIVLG